MPCHACQIIFCQFTKFLFFSRGKKRDKGSIFFQLIICHLTKLIYILFVKVKHDFFFTETTVVHNYENMLAAFIVMQAMKGSK